MTNQGWHRVAACAARVAIAMVALTAGLSSETQAQIKPSMKIKIDVSSSVGISQVEAGVQNLIAKEVAHLEESIAERAGGADPVSLSPGFSISAYENIRVLVSVTTPEQMSDGKDSVNAPQISCGYLNDGTTYFSRATITNKSAIQFRLRNNNLLKRSMKLENPLFVAYVFFVINRQKQKSLGESPLLIPTVTVEFL